MSVVKCEYCEATTVAPPDADRFWVYVCDDCLDRMWAEGPDDGPWGSDVDD